MKKRKDKTVKIKAGHLLSVRLFCVLSTVFYLEILLHVNRGLVDVAFLVVGGLGADLENLGINYLGGVEFYGQKIKTE